MYPIVLIAGLFFLLMALLGIAILVLLPRAKRPKAEPRPQRVPEPEPQPLFVAEFKEELNRLDSDDENDAYALHQKGVPVSRIASQLGLAKADVELLIKVGDRSKP